MEGMKKDSREQEESKTSQELLKGRSRWSLRVEVWKMASRNTGGSNLEEDDNDILCGDYSTTLYLIIDLMIIITLRTSTTRRRLLSLDDF